MKLAGETLWGVHSVADFATEANDEARGFAKRYRAKYGLEPDLYSACTYGAVFLLKHAIEKAKSTDTDKVVAAMAGQKFAAPDGYEIKMDEKNHHLWKPVLIGEIQANGQFNVVWKTKGPVRAQPWSQYIAGNDKKKDEPEKK